MSATARGARIMTKRKLKEPHPFDSLPFVSMKSKGPRNFWTVASTGDYTKDCELGREYAEQALLCMVVDDHSGGLLTHIVIGMMESFRPFPKEEWEKSSIANAKGIVVGFMREIQAHAERSKNIDQMLLHHPSVVIGGPDNTAWPSNKPLKLRIVEEDDGEEEAEAAS
jgi:hypothetical protein